MMEPAAHADLDEKWEFNLPATPPQPFDNWIGCSLAEESLWEGDTNV